MNAIKHQEARTEAIAALNRNGVITGSLPQSKVQTITIPPMKVLGQKLLGHIDCLTHHHNFRIQ